MRFTIPGAPQGKARPRTVLGGKRTYTPEKTVNYEALVKLTAWLLDTCHMDAETVIRHYDITGKDCPRYFVQNEESWHAFRADVARAAGGKG